MAPFGAPSNDALKGVAVPIHQPWQQGFAGQTGGSRTGWPERGDLPILKSHLPVGLPTRVGEEPVRMQSGRIYCQMTFSLDSAHLAISIP